MLYKLSPQVFKAKSKLKLVCGLPEFMAKKLLRNLTDCLCLCFSCAGFKCSGDGLQGVQEAVHEGVHPDCEP